MRLSIYVTTLSCLLVACGGSGGQDPILGTPGMDITPSVVSTTPATQTPVVSNVINNARVTAKFNTDMNAASLSTTSFTVACPASTPVTGTVTYDAANRLAILRHASVFPSGTTCEAKVTTAATNTAGTALVNDYVWSFTTQSSSDTTPPTVVANSPIINATTVCLDKSVSVVFSEAIAPATITASTFYVTDSSPANVPGTLTYDAQNKTATFVISNPAGYAPSASYTTHITTGVTDVAGNHIASDILTAFNTGTQACTPIAAVNLGTIATYGAFGGGAGATNSGINTVVHGDLGTTAACTLFTGFDDATNFYTETPLNIGEVTGNIYCAPPAPGTTAKLALATQAAADAVIAYNALAAKTPDVTLNSGQLSGLTLPPHTYKPAAGSLILSTGDLVLDAAGDADAVWVFQVASSLTIGLPALPSSVLLINGAQAKNVFWQVGSKARIEDGSTMVGTIIASAGVTISTADQTIQTTLTGRAIGLNASVTMVNTTIVAP